MLQLPFRKIYVLPAYYVNDYAWKSEKEICKPFNREAAVLDVFLKVVSI